MARTAHHVAKRRNSIDLQRRALDADIADSLREAILNGTLPPGSRLTELEIANQWNVSQATVRAALKTLSHDGLVQSRAHRGTYVTNLTKSDVLEIYTLRDSLEAFAARRAAERIDDRGRKQLKKILHDMRLAIASGNRKKMQELDLKFHRAIIDIAQHGRLLAIYASLEAQTRLFLSMTDQFHHDMRELLSIHEPLAEAIMIGDSERAFAIASHHSEPDGKALTEALVSHSEDENGA